MGAALTTQALTSTAALTLPHIEPSATSIQSGAQHVRRDSLLERAYSRMTRYRRSDAITPAAFSNAWLAISYLVTDDGATPQVASDGEGGLETEWLVDGQSVVVNALDDGTCFIWALDADGAVAFRSEFIPKWMAGEPTVNAAERLLRTMSERVRSRTIG